MVMTKSADNLGGLTNVKQGGKVHLVAGYKPDKTATEFAAKTDHVEIKWAEEPASEEGGEGGEISKGDEKTEDVDDGATSVTTFGAAVLAAISALAFWGQERASFLEMENKQKISEIWERRLKVTSTDSLRENINIDWVYRSKNWLWRLWRFGQVTWMFL